MPKLPPEERALLSAIIADPNDDTLRLAYADWLDEHDQPERAEFIRVQCAQASLRHGSAEYEQSGGELEERDTDLKEAFAKRWTAELGLPVNRQTHFWYRRGLVAQLWCTARYFLTHAPAIMAAVPLDAVAFRRLTAKNIDELAKFPPVRKLRGLQFLMDETQPELVVRLLRAVPIDKLQSLDLCCYTVGSLSPGWTTRNVSLGRELAKVSVLSHLTSLRLRHAGIGENGAIALASSPNLWEIRYLDLQDNGIGEQTEAVLRKRFGGALVLGRADYGRFTLGDLGWD